VGIKLESLEHLLAHRRVRRLARHLLGRTRWERLKGLWNDPLLKCPLLLVFQAPKAGSQTVEATLRQAGWPGELFRVHYLSQSWASWAEATLRTAEEAPDYHRNLLSQLSVAQRLRGILRARSFLRRCGVDIPKIQVISAVREPIGLLLSSLFENHQLFFPSLESVTAPRCAELVTTHPQLARLQSWFDMELKPLTGVNVFRSRFPNQDGFAIYENRCARVLVYRFESLGRIGHILETFLGRKLGEVIDANVSSRKEYAPTYAAIKASARFPSAFTREVCHSKMMRHFYSAEERNQLESRWSQL
jgi:hypothetical protein